MFGIILIKLICNYSTKLFVDDDLSHIVEEPLQGKDQSSNAEKISATKLILNNAASKQSMGLGKSTQSTSRASMSPPPTNPVMTFLIPDGNAVRPGVCYYTSLYLQFMCSL